MHKGESAYEMATRHVAEQRRRIWRQHALIDELRKLGVSTAQAERLLTSMDDLLEIMLADMEALDSQRVNHRSH
jgi:hypothetical protein